MVTCRNHYFKTNLKGRLSPPLQEVTVPEWTADQRDVLLTRAGVDPTALDPQAASSLLNPRLLGIALKVLPLKDPHAWQGLTVERLLFEHIRAGERDYADSDTVQGFVDRLTSHAQQVLDKYQSKQEDDLLIFEDQLEAAAEGRFFAPIPGPRNAYELRGEGLPLALGLALLHRLLYAQRNNKDLTESIGAALEPISTLDDTPSIVLAALTALALKEDSFDQDVYGALIRGFLFLQNPGRDHYPAFLIVAKERTTEFLHTAEELTLQTPQAHPNSDWMRAALLDLRDDPVWPLVESAIIRWLSYYTLDPNQQLPQSARSSSEDTRQEKIAANRLAIQDKLNSLSESERKILAEMHESPYDPTALTRLAIRLLPGLRLAPFAAALVRAALSNALNGGIHWPREQFRHLLAYNSRDWASARSALLREGGAFRAGDASRTGMWALVTILDGTGDGNDAQERTALVATLRPSAPWRRSWRLIEDYCAVDPCDPRSEQPGNVANTATKYQQVDVTQLHLDLWCTGEGAFLEDALPAMARFYPEVAVRKHVQLLGQLLLREDLPLRHLVLQASAHRPLVDRSTALGLVEILRSASAFANCTEEDRRAVASYLLLHAFPMLTGPEQAEAMLLTPEPENYLLSLFSSVKSLDPAHLESELQAAIAQDDGASISVLLAFAKYSETPLTTKVRRVVGSLTRSEVEGVRADAFEAIYRRELSDLLPAALESGCSYTDCRNEDSREAWFGSLTLVDAAEQGLTDPITVLDRIMPQLFRVAVQKLGSRAEAEIGRRLLLQKDVNHPLLEEFSMEAFSLLHRAVPGALIELADSFLASERAAAVHFHNVALLTAYAISADDPERARALFLWLEESQPFLTLTEGYAGLTLDQRALWYSARSALLDELRYRRLDRAATDHELAMEVLAAEDAGRQEVLDEYVAQKCGSGTPVVVARGLMVAGFCDDRPGPARVLADHAARAGLISRAHSSAQYAFERNRWARHWYERMCETEDPVHYWLNWCLFAKVVDGRFELWEHHDSPRSSPLNLYREVTEHSVDRRCERWKRKREKRLFGQDAPEPLFLE